TSARFLRRCRPVSPAQPDDCNRRAEKSRTSNRNRDRDSPDNQTAIVLSRAGESCRSIARNKRCRQLSRTDCASLTPSSGGESVLFLCNCQVWAAIGNCCPKMLRNKERRYGDRDHGEPW